MSRSKPADVVARLIHLDRSSSSPLYEQIARSLRDAVRDGRLSAGAKIPSSREMARRLGVNRATVVAAFRLLQEEGTVVSGVGSGTYVRSEASAAPIPAPERTGFWASRLGDLPRPEEGRSTALPDGTIRFTSPTADPSTFPVEEFRTIVDGVFETEGASCLDYGPPDGLAALRSYLAERLERQGVSVDPSRVLLVHGSQQGLDLVLRVLAGRGRSLLVEEPTYPLTLRTARALGIPVRPIAMDADGMRVDRLERILRESEAGLLYTMPAFQNPTGLTLSPERRGRLLAIAKERNLPIVEDHFDADLTYEGSVPRPLLADGVHPGVILLGTFSKVLFPGPRIGWLVVPEPLIGPLTEMKVCADLSSGVVMQMALHRFCESGRLDQHIAEIRLRYKSRLAATLDALDRCMPEGARWTRPRGGMTLWVWLPDGLDSEDLARETQARGVAFTPGPVFHADGGGRDGLRLCFVRENEERIGEGVRILAETIRRMAERAPERARRSAAAPML